MGIRWLRCACRINRQDARTQEFHAKAQRRKGDKHPVVGRLLSLIFSRPGVLAVNPGFASSSSPRLRVKPCVPPLLRVKPLQERAADTVKPLLDGTFTK